MTNYKISSTQSPISIQAAEDIERGRFITADGYMWTGTTPKDLPIAGVSLECVKEGQGIPVATNDGDRVVVESGIAIAVGDKVYSDAVGRATTVSTSHPDGGIAVSVASGVGEETLIILRIVNL